MGTIRSLARDDQRQTLNHLAGTAGAQAAIADAKFPLLVVSPPLCSDQSRFFVHVRGYPVHSAVGFARGSLALLKAWAEPNHNAGLRVCQNKDAAHLEFCVGLPAANLDIVIRGIAAMRWMALWPEMGWRRDVGCAGRGSSVARPYNCSVDKVVLVVWSAMLLDWS